MARLFNDSKTFVDMKLKFSPEVVKTHFEDLKLNNPCLDKNLLEKFVEDNFTLENQMENVTPEDWISDPKLLSRISDGDYAYFAGELNARWKSLCRKIKNEVADNPDQYSLIYLPNPVIVPGGRFREIYYWDRYDVHFR